METSKDLKKVIMSCLDDARMLRLESDFVRSVERGAVLERLADEREAFAEDLARLEFVREGTTPIGHGSIAGRFREAKRTFRVALGARNDGDAVAACRRSLHRVAALYDAALSLDWNDDHIRRVLRQQRERIEAEGDQLTVVLFGPVPTTIVEWHASH